MDNFTRYIGLIVTGILKADPSVEVRMSQNAKGFFVKVRKGVPLTDRVATYHMTLPHDKIVQASPMYLDVTANSEVDKVMQKLDAVVRGQLIQ